MIACLCGPGLLAFLQCKHTSTEYSTRKGVMHMVQAPAFIGRGQHHHGRARRRPGALLRQCAFASLLTGHGTARAPFRGAPLSPPAGPKPFVTSGVEEAASL
jgi:hypothetical protein